MRRETLILVAVLVILAAVYLITQRPFSTHGPRSPAGEELFFPDFVAAEVDTLSTRGQGIDVTLFRTGEGWMIQGARPMYAAPAKVEQALEMIAALPKTELVSIVPEKHAVFEVIEGPATRVVARGGGRALADVLVGKRGPGFLTAYVRAPDADEVYLSQRGFPSNVVRPTDFWRDREILSFEPDQATRISIEREGQSVVLAYLGEPGWQMLEPADRPADSAAVAEAIAALSLLSASGFEDMRSPDECGLDDPTAVISVQLTAGPEGTVTIGSEEEDSYYVRRSDRETIYRIPATRLDRVLRSPEEFAPAEG
jgi:hypothetical protein